MFAVASSWVCWTVFILISSFCLLTIFYWIFTWGWKFLCGISSQMILLKQIQMQISLCSLLLRWITMLRSVYSPFRKGNSSEVTLIHKQDLEKQLADHPIQGAITWSCRTMHIHKTHHVTSPHCKSVLLNASVAHKDYFIYIFSEIKFLSCRRDAERLAETEEKPRTEALQTKCLHAFQYYTFLSFFLFPDYNIRTAWNRYL